MAETASRFDNRCIEVAWEAIPAEFQDGMHKLHSSMTRSLAIWYSEFFWVRCGVTVRDIRFFHKLFNRSIAFRMRESQIALFERRKAELSQAAAQQYA